MVKWQKKCTRHYKTYQSTTYQWKMSTLSQMSKAQQVQSKPRYAESGALWSSSLRPEHKSDHLPNHFAMLFEVQVIVNALVNGLPVSGFSITMCHAKQPSIPKNFWLNITSQWFSVHLTNQTAHTHTHTPVTLHFQDRGSPGMKNNLKTSCRYNRISHDSCRPFFETGYHTCTAKWKHHWSYCI